MSRLELQHESGGRRHYLNGEPVHAGEILEMYRDGKWITGRYEWTFREDELPVFYVNEAGGYIIKSDDDLRWPTG